MPSAADLEIAELRAFNRVYTRRLGLLDAHLDGSPFSLSEARVLYEIANRDQPTAAQVCRALGLDRAQISRTLKRFSARGLIEAQDDPGHGRQQLISLTPIGAAAFASLEVNTRRAIGTMLEALPATRKRRLLAAAQAMSDALTQDQSAGVRLRGLRPGDLGLVTARQAILYADEYGWNGDYEALVARILADFHEGFDSARDAAWIADLNGGMVGSVFLVHGDQSNVGKLRLLYVEPDARGSGVGALLVAACVDQARAFGYERLELWTNSVLTAARSLYVRAGFRLIEEAPHRSFGRDLVGQTWALAL